MKLRNLLLLFLFCILISTSAFTQSVMDWQKNILQNNVGSSSPQTLARGDINGDGLSDIVSGDAYAGICWFKNIDGNGTFGSSNSVVNTSGSYGVSNIFIADIDEDGYNDIVYVSTLTYWVKNLDGNGTFGTPITISTTTYSTIGLQVLDMDNDGDFDIIQCRVTSSPSYTIELLKNNGNGTFTSPISIAGSSFMLRFTAIDINGDALPDIVYESPSAVVYYQQNSNNTFPSTFTENMGSTSNNMSSGMLNMGNIMGGDIDGDGDNDIVNIYQNGAARSIKWFRNDNNVFSNSQVLLNIPPDNGSASNDYFKLRLRDLDNNGKVDIIIHNSFTNSLTWYKNLGSSTFGTQQLISNTVLQNRDVLIADINSDTKLDIMAPDASNNVIKWFSNNNGNATSFTEFAIDDNVNLPFLGDIGDIDGNGTKDIVLASRNTGKLVWRKNNGAGNYSDLPNIITTSLPSFTSIILIDANNDGHKDIVCSSTNEKIVWLTNNGQGNFSNEQTLFTSNVHTLIAEDVDNDGDKDLIAYYSYTNSSVTSSDLKVFKNNGNGFDAPNIFSYPTNTFKSIKTIDMDNDGDLDFMIYLSTSTPQNAAGLYWIENTNGQGNYATLHPTNLALVSSKNFDIADWNEDGLNDLVYNYRTQIGVRYLKTVTINNDGTLGTPENMTIPGADFNLLKLVDLDNDGDLDILAQINSGNIVFGWYENIGNNAFTYRSIFNSTVLVTTPNFLEDINADGNIDFAFTDNNTNSEVAWYKNLGLNFNQIKGNVSLDVLLNGCTNGNVAAQQVLVTTTDSNSNESISVFTTPTGNFSFKVEAGSYSTSVTHDFPYFNSNPSSETSLFSSNTGESIVNFCLVPTQFFNDLEISFYPLGDARPGFNAKYRIVAKNKGTNLINTTIGLQYNNQKVNFANALPLPISQTLNSMVFEIANLQPFQTFQATVTFLVNTIPTVTIGETIAFALENNLSNDITPENNSILYNQQVVGSYDPNDMLVLEGAQVAIDDSDKYLHYIIRFQNTGNYFAERVLITTLLDDKLDWETIELEGSSHANRVEISNGSLMNFIFDAIYLPAVSTNEEASKGHVAFKVKPKSSVVENDTVLGTASIYFDSNPPIITNQVATTFVSTLSVADFESNKLSVYPNPTNVILNIAHDVSIKTIEIYNYLGQLMLSEKETSLINVSNLSEGIYTLILHDSLGKTFVKKFIKK